MSDCIFCKIIKGEIPSYKIYEDEYTYAFLDIAKDVDGHILVVPKKHCTNILDCDSETMTHVMDTVKKISNHLVDDLGYDGINIANCSGESAGQTVFHLHIHILPHKKGQPYRGFPSLPGSKRPVEEVFDEMKMV